MGKDSGMKSTPEQESIRFCKRCVISNRRPSSTQEFLYSPGDTKKSIGFDKDGVCEACLYSDIKKVDVDWDDREKQLERLAGTAKKVNGYDVVVPGSGGKDSAYTAHILKYKYGMNPLTVTWSPHLYTQVGITSKTGFMSEDSTTYFLRQTENCIVT
jgi:hypothetical protein